MKKDLVPGEKNWMAPGDDPSSTGNDRSWITRFISKLKYIFLEDKAFWSKTYEKKLIGV